MLFYIVFIHDYLVIFTIHMLILGGKITQSESEGIIINDNTGNRYTFENDMECATLTGMLELMWTHSRESLSYCRLLERTLSHLPRPSFPVIVGRRPSSDGSGKENNAHRMLVSISVHV